MSKAIYGRCCETRAQEIPVFQQPWWLDTVCGAARWEAQIERSESGSETWIWPVFKKHFGPLGYLTMPPMTQQVQPLLIPDRLDAMEYGQWKVEAPYQRLCLPETMTPWLEKNGFETTPAFSYQIAHLSDMDQYLKKCNELSRRNIQKATRQLTIVCDDDAATLYRLSQQSMQRHGLSVALRTDMLERCVAGCFQRQKGAVFKAVDAQGRVHAAAFVVWDNMKMYYVLAGMDEQINQVGASRLIMWHTIQMAFQQGLDYDFHGGMSLPVGSVYASMGAVPMPYVRATRYRPAFLKRLITTAKRLYAPNDSLFH